MAGIDFKIIFAEEGGAGPAGKSTDPGKDPATQETAELPAVAPTERVTGPKADRWKGTPQDSGGKKKAEGPELTEAIKGLGRFAAGHAGLGPVVSTLETLTKHLVNVYQAVMRGATSVPRASGGGLPDAGGVEVKSPKAPSVPTIPAAPPVVGPAGAVPAVAAAPAVTQAGAGTGAAAAGGAAAALGPLAPVAIAAAVALAGVAAGAVAVKVAFDALRAEGDRIQGYSAELSAAYAMSDIRSELADMRRAQRIGPNAARVENMRSKVDDKIAEIGDEIYAGIAEILLELKPFLPTVLGLLEITKDGVQMTVEELKVVIELLKLLSGPAVAGNAVLTLMLKHLASISKNTEKETDDINDPFAAQLLAQFGQKIAALPVAAPKAMVPLMMMGMPIGRPGVAAGFGGP